MLYLSITGDIAKYIKEAIINAWRFLNGQLDSIAYKLLSSLYDFFKQLSEVYLYNEKIMQTIGKRIALVLGIFVLFRLAVALVSYIINPDKLADSSKGTKKIITNIALSLILLGTVNIIFKEAYILQKKIVASQVIEKMFFGEKASIEDVDISYYLYGAFVQVNLPECENDDIYNSEEISEQCAQRLNSGTTESNTAIRTLVIDKMLTSRNIRPILSSYNNINEKVDGDYLFDYTPVISLVCAIVAILMLLSSCMDVATRIIKLLFLQIIAPIPIVSNMAPGKGEESFKKWYKECINTYLSLFIRITVISFAIFMISLIKTEFAEIFSGRNIMIQVLLIIGCLIFAKQAPKLIEDIFGIKMDGMLLHPLKKFQDQALFGKQITGVAAAGAAGVAAFGSNTYANKGNIFSGFAGAGSAFARGTVGAVKGEKFGQIYKNSYRGAIEARNKRQDMKDDHVKPLEAIKSSATHKLGGYTTNDRVKSTNDNLQKLQNIYKSMMSSLEGADDVAGSITGTGSFAGLSFDGIKGLTKFEDEVKKTTIDRDSFRQQATSRVANANNGNASEDQIQAKMDELYNTALANQQQKLKEIDDMKKARLDGIANGTIQMPAEKKGTQNAITQGYEEMKKLTKDINATTRKIDSNISIIDEDAKASKMNGLSKGVSSELVTNKAAIHAQNVDKYAAKKDSK